MRAVSGHDSIIFSYKNVAVVNGIDKDIHRAEA